MLIMPCVAADEAFAAEPPDVVPTLPFTPAIKKVIAACVVAIQEEFCTDPCVVVAHASLLNLGISPVSNGSSLARVPIWLT